MGKVKIKGSLGYNGAEFNTDDPYIVELSDGFYHKEDTSTVTSVGGRYYRVESPLIVRLHKFYGSRRYALKEDAREYEGYYHMNKDFSKKLVLDRSGVSCREFPSILLNVYSGYDMYYNGEIKTIYIEDVSLLNDHDITQCSVTSKLVFKKDATPIFHRSRGASLSSRVSDKLRNGLPLSDAGIVEKYFIKEICNTYIGKQIHLYKGMYYYGQSLIFTTDTKGKAYRVMCSIDEYNQMSKADRVKMFEENFSETHFIPLSSGLNRIESALSASRTTLLDKSLIEGLTYCKELDFYTDISKSSLDSRIEDLKKRAKSLFNLLVVNGAIPPHLDEKCPTVVVETGTQGGNHLHYESSNRDIDISPTKRLTGGIGYTFGIEMETSYGVLPNKHIEKYGFKAVGDRSIGALEYVSKPLHGDSGVKLIRNAADKMSEFCVVDNRCGIHIHIGGHKDADSPSFNRRFSVFALKLGVILQDEMFSLVSPNRTANVNRDGLAYCGKIPKKFGAISMGNYKKLLAQYVFGDQEEFSPSMNSKSRLFRWTPTRYRWLNLINCNSDNGGRSDAGSNSRFQTIEFRLWDGTLNKDDIYRFTLISMAFAKFADCHQSLIKRCPEEINLDFVLRNTLSPIVYKKTISWAEERKEKIKKVYKTKNQ